MQLTDFTLLDVNKLVFNLNENLADGEVYLGERGSWSKRKTIYPASVLLDSERTWRAKYPLLTEGYCPVGGIIGLEREERAGYILVESGFIDRTGSDMDGEWGGIYESIKLGLRRPLEMKGGVLVPRSTIKLLYEQLEWSPHVDVERRDHQRFLIGWKGADYSEAIPNEWFTRDDAVGKLRNG